jgi:hypothetical protein
MELDRLMGTERWKVRASEMQDPFAERTARLQGMVGGRSAMPEERGVNGDTVGVMITGIEW